MKKLTSILTAICIIISATACSQGGNFTHTSWGNGERVVASNTYVTKQLKVDNFEKLNVIGSMDVEFIQAPGAPKVEVYTSDNIVEVLEINVRNNTLYVGFKKGYSISYNKLEVRVSAEDINNISLAGSGDVYLKNGINTEKSLTLSLAGSGDIDGKGIKCSTLTATVAGSGDIEVGDVVCKNIKASVAGSGDLNLNNVDTEKTEVSIAGSGEAVLSGTSQSASLSVAGSGDIYVEKLKTKQVKANVAGSGSIKCFATEHLDASVSGSGEVGYKGNPTVRGPKKKLYKL